RRAARAAVARPDDPPPGARGAPDGDGGRPCPLTPRRTRGPVPARRRARRPRGDAPALQRAGGERARLLGARTLSRPPGREPEPRARAAGARPARPRVPAEAPVA